MDQFTSFGASAESLVTVSGLDAVKITSAAKHQDSGVRVKSYVKFKEMGRCESSMSTSLPGDFDLEFSSQDAFSGGWKFKIPSDWVSEGNASLALRFANSSEFSDPTAVSGEFKYANSRFAAQQKAKLKNFKDINSLSLNGSFAFSIQENLAFGLAYAKSKKDKIPSFDAAAKFDLHGLKMTAKTDNGFEQVSFSFIHKLLSSTKIAGIVNIKKEEENSYKLGIKKKIDEVTKSSIKAYFKKDANDLRLLSEFSSKFQKLENASISLSLDLDLLDLNSGKHKMGCILSFEA